MSRDLDAEEGVKVPASGAAEGESPALRGERSPSSYPLDRRSFLKCALASGATLGVGEFLAVPSFAGPQKQDDSRFTVEAKFYQKLQNKKIKCKLCPRECTVGDRERGYCGVRENHGEPTTRWCTRGCALYTSIPSRRSHCSTTCRGRLLSRWPRPAAT